MEPDELTEKHQGSCVVQVALFVTDWWWREKWLKTPVSPWRGPFPTKADAMKAAGVSDGRAE